MSRFAIQAIQINNSEYAGTTGTTVDRGFNTTTENSDGVVQETVQFVEQEAASAEVTTWALGTILGILGTSGTSVFPFLALDGSNGLVMAGAKAASNAPAFAGSSVHLARTGLNGVIYMSNCRWSLKQKAEMTLKAMLVGNGDGTTAAVVASTIALPTQVQPTEGWTLSALTINGVGVVAVGRELGRPNARQGRHFLRVEQSLQLPGRHLFFARSVAHSLLVVVRVICHKGLLMRKETPCWNLLSLFA